MRGTEYAELSAFVTVAEQQNFARAATHLGVVPSTLSQTIRNLEERLGVRLFNRTTRSVALTEAGDKLYTRICPLFEEMQCAVESIHDFRDVPAGTLRLSVSAVPAQMVLIPLLKGFLARYPAINVDISLDNTDSDIVSGRFDAGIRYGLRIEKDMLRVQVCPQSRLMAFASPEYIAQHAVPVQPQDLQQHVCIRYRKPDCEMQLWRFEKDEQTVEVAVTGSLIVNDVDLLIKAVRGGMGIGFMVADYIQQDIAQGTLVPLLDDWSPSIDPYYLYYPNRHQQPAPLRLFISYLREYVDSHPKG